MPSAPFVPCCSRPFCLFRPKCGLMADPSNANTARREKCDDLGRGAKLDAEPPSDERQLPTALHGGRFDRDAEHAHFTSK